MNLENFYEALENIRNYFLEWANKLPQETRKDAALYVLKTLTAEFEHLPAVSSELNIKKSYEFCPTCTRNQPGVRNTSTNTWCCNQCGFKT
jgi:hypothetical protein